MPGISYARRPAKHVQRRMVVDALRRMRAFSELPEYQYVGFGGMEFVDFELVHRELGISNMVSIELDSAHAARYRFNVPFATVRLFFDRASAVLPGLLDEPVLRVVWLDYECSLNLEVLQDLGTALRRLIPGSALVISVNAQSPSPATTRLKQFTANVGADRVPSGATDATLARWGWAQASYDVLTADAEAETARRGDGCAFEQVFHFRYADGARMLTWGGVLVGPANRPAFAAADFPSLDQVRTPGDPPYEIMPPLLTMREALHLNAQLPNAAPDELHAQGISADDLRSYTDLYRWYPTVPASM
jgi:hypothetical protein